jgi:membrane protease YdiL (CAAX protease family)
MGNNPVGDHEEEEKEIKKSPTDALIGSVGGGDPEVIRYFLFLIFYLFILLIFSNFFSPLIAFILWIAMGFGIYKVAENYGEDVPWIKQVLEKVQNIGFTSTSPDTTPEAIETGVDEPKEEKAADLDNYAEKFDEWRVTKDTISPILVSAEDRITSFSFNTPGLYKVRLWMFLILAPLLIWVVMWDIISWPFQIWFSLWFSWTDAVYLSRICSLILSYFIIIRIYSHCTNNRNLPINSEMMSDFDGYVVMHLFRLPRDYASFKLTFKALLFDFIGGYLLLIFTSLYAMQAFSAVFSVSFDDFISHGYLSLIIALLSIAVFVPVMEELMFRGFVLDLASEAYGKWAAIFISAILFALIHPLYILTVLNAFWAGLVYGYLRICTNSLWPSILLHSLWNSHIILLAFYS